MVEEKHPSAVISPAMTVAAPKMAEARTNVDVDFMMSKICGRGLEVDEKVTRDRWI